MTLAAGRETSISAAEALLADLRSRLEAGGCENPRLLARWIAEDVLGCDYSRIRAGLAGDPTPEQSERALEYVRARLAGLPLAHVIGHTGFYGYRFRVTPGVMVPRNETEALVDAAISLIDEASWREPSILDCYTGCGNILLSIMTERPNAHGTGIEIDADAVRCAESNQAALGCERARFVCGDVSRELNRIESQFHLVTANPPYIPTQDIPNLPREISEHEKRAALDGGPDSLDHYRALAAKAPRMIVPGGFLLAEIGAARENQVSRVFSGWTGVTFRPDLDGRPRVLVAQP